MIIQGNCGIEDKPCKVKDVWDLLSTLLGFPI